MSYKNKNSYKQFRKNKYSNQRTIIDGISFDSRKEARRWTELLLMRKAGIISNLERQMKFVLIPAQYEEVNGKSRCIERECAYIADFVYTNENGETVVEDVKGFRTPEYIQKRKMMLYFHGIRIKEV